MQTNNISYKNFDAVITSEGVVIVSKMGVDYPIVILNNQSFRFVVYLADEVNFKLQYEVDCPMLDFTSMITYGVEIQGSPTWAVAIPYRRNSLEIGKFFNEDNMAYVNKRFSADDIPTSLYGHMNIAIITGFCE
jgi:hypothetical protein